MWRAWWDEWGHMACVRARWWVGGWSSGKDKAGLGCGRRTLCGWQQDPASALRRHETPHLAVLQLVEHNTLTYPHPVNNTRNQPAPQTNTRNQPDPHNHTHTPGSTRAR